MDQPTTNTQIISKSKLWTGRIFSSLVVLFLSFDIVIHLLKPQPVIDSFNQLGLPLNLSIPIAIIALFCVILYAIPKTSILGAILLTGYLGGAVLTNLRAGTSLFGNVLFPVYFGFFVWGGLYLRDQSLQKLVPFKK